jgi:hypothetical protein
METGAVTRHSIRSRVQRHSSRGRCDLTIARYKYGLRAADPVRLSFPSAALRFHPVQIPLGAVIKCIAIGWLMWKRRVFVEAAKKSGRQISRAALVNSLEQLQNFQTGVIGPVTFGPIGESAREAPSRRNRSGKKQYVVVVKNRAEVIVR